MYLERIFDELMANETKPRARMVHHSKKIFSAKFFENLLREDRNSEDSAVHRGSLCFTSIRSVHFISDVSFR